MQNHQNIKMVHYKSRRQLSLTGTCFSHLLTIVPRHLHTLLRLHHHFPPGQRTWIKRIPEHIRNFLFAFDYMKQIIFTCLFKHIPCPCVGVHSLVFQKCNKKVCIEKFVIFEIIQTYKGFRSVILWQCYHLNNNG